MKLFRTSPKKIICEGISSKNITPMNGNTLKTTNVLFMLSSFLAPLFLFLNSSYLFQEGQNNMKK